MNKWRTTLVIALLAVLAAATGLWLVPFWLAKAGAVLLVCVALGLLINLVFTIFKANEQDPWDTTYFKYMRALWENAWGGSEFEFVLDEYGYKTDVKRPLQIDTCRANYLAMWTGIAWLMLISTVGFAVYLSIYALATGALPPFLSYTKAVPLLILFTLLFGFVGSGLFILILLYTNTVGKVYPRFRKRVITTWLLFAGATNAVSLIILPVSQFGLIKFLTWVGAGAAMVVAAFGIILLLNAVIALCAKIGERIFGQETAPGQLMAQRKAGLKQRICLIIKQKEKPS